MAPSLVPAMKSPAKQGNVVTDRVHTYGNVIVCLARQAGPGLQRPLADPTVKAATEFAAFATILVPSAYNVGARAYVHDDAAFITRFLGGLERQFSCQAEQVKTQTTIKLCEPRSISPTSVH
jgi:hypothetical protein